MPVWGTGADATEKEASALRAALFPRGVAMRASAIDSSWKVPLRRTLGIPGSNLASIALLVGWALLGRPIDERAEEPSRVILRLVRDHFNRQTIPILRRTNG